MALFEKALEAKVMSTHLLIRANVSKTILYQAHKIATDFESRYTAYQEHSFLNQINQNAGIKPIPCTAEDTAFFEICLNASKHTKGLFDISIGALSHGVYHFGFSNQSLPSASMLCSQKRLVNAKDILLVNDSIFLKHKGMRIDVGGIGKGYVAKQISLFLAQKGATKILVDLGGEIITRGKSYTISIQDPFSKGNIAYLKTSTQDMSISTSGNYARFIDEQNHHILDSSKGTSPSYYSSMTLLQNGWKIDYLDAYATALFNQAPSTLEEISQNLNISLITINTQAMVSLYHLKDLEIEGLKF
ncbi:MAG: FAD:protein FMN transferase [Sulfurovum sp.]|nr:FAD:protein FMN transferase [Sulfurovum sp.]